MTQDAAPPQGLVFGAAEKRCAQALIDLALAEDLGDAGDLTSVATIPAEARGVGIFVARAPGVVCGLPVVEKLAKRFGLDPVADGPWSHVATRLEDGARVEPGSEIARVTGPMRSLLAMERTALNFLQRLSGVATMTSRFVAAVEWTRAEIFDTRKTTPGWRALEKYAVRCGGGKNHRIGLFDAVLIKDNHLASIAAGGEPDPIGRAVASARELSPPGTIVEVEVDSLEQLDRALQVRPDVVLIDNFDLADMAEAVGRRDRAARDVKLEASGGINLESVAAIARTGVDRISAGALTHSAPAMDIALDFAEAAAP